MPWGAHHSFLDGGPSRNGPSLGLRSPSEVVTRVSILVNWKDRKLVGMRTLLVYEVACTCYSSYVPLHDLNSPSLG
jgi:hypothetical protein